MRNYGITQISDLPSYLQITLNAMESEEDDIVLQGVEFWSSVCDEEIELQIEAAEAQETNTNPSTYSRHYAKGALQFIVPILLPILTKQEEHDDEEGWTPHKAAGVCLMLLASCCPKDIVPFVLPFITTNLQSQDWKKRDAAVMAFGKNISFHEQFFFRTRFSLLPGYASNIYYK